MANMSLYRVVFLFICRFVIDKRCVLLFTLFFFRRFLNSLLLLSLLTIVIYCSPKVKMQNMCVCAACTVRFDSANRLVFKWSERYMMRMRMRNEKREEKKYERIDSILDYLCQNEHDKTKNSKCPNSAKKNAYWSAHTKRSIW